MSHFANTVLAEHPLPVPPTYYPRNSPRGPAASGAMLVSLPSHQTPSHPAMWPHYYADPTSLPAQSATFPSYIAPAAPSVSPSPSACAPCWQSTTTPTAFTSAGPDGHVPDFQRCVVRQAVAEEYQTPLGSPPQPNYAIPTQHTVLPPSPQLSPSLSSLYRFRNDRNRSPASHVSPSEYARWSSPRSTAGESEYCQSAPMGVTEATDDETTSYVDDFRDGDELSPAQSSSSSQTPVKLEPDDREGCFIMELSAFPPDTPSSHAAGRSALHAYTTSLLSQSLAPPTEVPLRATQASKEMRKLMSAFRVNPFAMHSLSVNDGGKEGLEWLESDHGQATWCGGEARPLEEEPLMFEFQLDLNWAVDQDADSQESSEMQVRDREDGGDYAGGSAFETKDEPGLRCFSPSFELHSDDVDPGIRQHEDFLATPENQDTENEFGEVHCDLDQDQDQQSESWGGVNVSNHSEASANGSTDTRSGNMPLNEGQVAPSAQVQGTHRYRYELSPPSKAGWPESPVNGQGHSNGECYSVLSSSESVASKMSMTPPSHGSVKVPRLHATTSHPYLRNGVHSYPVAPSHTDVSSHAHRTSHAQPPGLQLLNQAAHHSYPHSNRSLHYHHPQPPNQHDDENSLSQSRQHQSQQQTLGVYHHSTSMSDAVRESLQRVSVPMVPSYMRVIRSSRGSEVDYQQGVGAYTARSTGNEVGGYASSSETSTGGLPSGTVPPQLHDVQTNTNVDGLAMNRRWSLPETGVSQGITGHFLTGM